MVRIKHRYLLVNILYPEADPAVKVSAPSDGTIVDFRKPSPSSLHTGHLIRHVRDHTSFLFGDYGAGVTGIGLAIKYFSPATSTFILRCPRAHYRLVWAALTQMTHLPKLDSGRGGSQSTQSPNHPCVMRVVRVSGTLRKSEEEAIRRARSDILRAQRQAAGDLSKSSAGGTLHGLLGGSTADAGLVEDADMDDAEDEDDSDLGSEA